MLKTLIPIAAALVAAAPAQAGTYSIAVPYGDLNMSTANGRATFAGRVDNAADRLCARNGIISLREMVASRQCRTAFAAQADALTARFAQRGGSAIVAAR